MSYSLPAPETHGQKRRVAFVFPGQGAKRVHEALRFVTRRDSGLALCEEAARAADVPLSRILARPSLLDNTAVLQPMLAAISLFIAQRLTEQGITPDVVLGHSAGEIAALAVAGAFSVEQAISLSALRGRLMAREAALHPGGMVALATSDQAVIEETLAIGRQAGSLAVAAYNAPDETVLSGEEAAIRAVLSSAPAQATRLPTTGAWHSPLMEGALLEWRAAFDEMSTELLRCAVVVNRTGEIAAPGADGRLDIGAVLGEQLVRPVELGRALGTARGLSDDVVLIGPGAVLRALWHKSFGRFSARVESRTTLLDTEDERALSATILALRGWA